MSRVVCHQSASLDGYVAGPDQSLENPIGAGSKPLHEWMRRADEPGHEADVAWRKQLQTPAGAVVMGRNMFGPVRGEWGPGPWGQEWTGWWGEEPPYHAPVFVLTHHPRESIEMKGGTTFHFVAEGFDVAFARARETAGDLDVRIAGGASTVRQALAAGVVDELHLDVVPVLLVSGERLFDGTVEVSLTPLEAIHSPRATHIRYRVER